MKQLIFDRNPIWERQKGDTTKSFAAYSDYQNLPNHSRSIAALYKIYQQRRIENHQERKNPTNSELTLRRWCSQYRFRERVRAYDDDLAIRLAAKREALKETQINEQLESEQQQVEDFRNSCLTLGRDIVSFSQTIIDLISTVPKAMQGRELVDKDFEKLSKVAIIFKNTVPSISTGAELCAQSLGISQALAVLEENRSGESA
jgi:hypothetical protein